MRRAPSRAEDRIWSWLRGRGFEGYKFRRQYPIGRYILDFYCPELRLGIELDGLQHCTPWMLEYDDRRSLALRTYGIEVLRISNDLLIRDALMTADCIRAAIERARKLRGR